ncbi:MAG: acyltransferase family protein [Parvularculaceae bacterium]|nr:acyltransferase family protein [Parvularculaceae bacterium]
MSLPSPSRRYDLDWLRAIAFGLLIAYHIGMAYVPWGWHVKSANGSEAWRLPMLLVNPWRLSLLFLISGVALRFALDKQGRGPVAASRALRLGLPIVVGMALVVMPQSYFEQLEKGEIEPGILAFWPAYLSFEQQFSIITPTWNHLWYIVYLFIYVPVLAFLYPLLVRISKSRAFETVAGRPLGVLLGLALPFIFYRYGLEPRFPTTHALFDDWNTHAVSFTILIVGFLIAKSEAFWNAIRKGLPIFLSVAIILGVWRGLVATASDTDAAAIAEFWISVITLTWPLASVLYAWSVILSLLGLAQRFLNKPSPLLTYLTGAVFCWYILHQTITVTLVAKLTPLKLGGPLELALVASGTIAGCAVGYELLKRVPWVRVAFGIKA